MQSPHPWVPRNPRAPQCRSQPCSRRHRSQRGLGSTVSGTAEPSLHINQLSGEQRFLSAKINSPQSKLGARPGRAAQPPEPRGSHPHAVFAFGSARWTQGSPWSCGVVEHPRGRQGFHGKGVWGKRVCFRALMLHPQSCCIPGGTFGWAPPHEPLLPATPSVAAI